ncbi:MAG: NTP transferase domain-containing protein, partial [Planctomycetales bacterium]|nr:NTP transferase domain-containing protein [Planctomycetales bacterium]
MRSFAVVPAAGESRRMGRPKLLLPWGDSTVIQTVLAAWQASRVDRVLVVVRPDDAELAEVCRRAGATVVVPGESPPEMKRSIQLALHEIHHRHAPTDADAWLLA